jgi:hypothetical protein
VSETPTLLLDNFFSGGSASFSYCHIAIPAAHFEPGSVHRQRSIKDFSLQKPMADTSASATHSMSSHELIPALATSQLMRRELKLYRESCLCTQRVYQRATSLYRQLDRVLVFDLRFRWWGLGNNLGRWLTLLRVGLASGRATYLWMSDDNDSAKPLFDLGRYFVSEASGSWRWTPATAERVRQRMASHKINASEPLTIAHHCLRVRQACEEHELRWAGGGVHRGDETSERDGSLLKFLTQRRERWLVIKPMGGGRMTAFQPSSRAAFGVLSGHAGVAWGGGWGGGDETGAFPSCWHSNSSLRARDPTSRSTASHLPASAAKAMLASEFSSGQALRSRMTWRCEAFALLRPRASLQRLMAPTVLEMDRVRRATGSISGLHMRTGYTDWVALASSSSQGNGTARTAWQAAVDAPPLPFAQHWRGLEVYLQDCSRTGSGGGGGGGGSNTPAQRATPCFNWQWPHAGRSPSTTDAIALCGGAAQSSPSKSSAWSASAAVDALGLPSSGPLSAAVACATLLRGGSRGRGARSTLEPWEGPAGLLVLGEAPGVIGLVRRVPGLANLTVDTTRTGSLGHTQFDTLCEGAEAAARAVGRGDLTLTPPSSVTAGGVEPSGPARCSKGEADPGGSWSRTMVDFYVAGLVDALVSCLDTSFTFAVLVRSLGCCTEGSRVHFSAASNAATNRDRPMESTGFLRVLMHEPQPPASP